MHRRVTPRHHAFRYRVFSLLLNLEELPRIAASSWLFSWNRWGVFSFHDKDHGDGRPLRVWLNDHLAKTGIVADGPVHLLCYPRLFGYVFNPLSVWFCYAMNGTLKAIVYEVHNTYGERHAYVMTVAPGEKIIRQQCPKDFYVSPFLSMDGAYRFRVSPPGKDIAISIGEEESGKPTLTALFTGKHKALSDRNLFAMLLRHPLMTLKIIIAIHFEAVRLMRKGIKQHPHHSEIKDVLETPTRNRVRA